MIIQRTGEYVGRSHVDIITKGKAVSSGNFVPLSRQVNNCMNLAHLSRYPVRSAQNERSGREREVASRLERCQSQEVQQKTCDNDERDCCSEQ